MFQKVRLLTADKRFVGFATIPNFNPPADVLVWGSRTFKRESGVTASPTGPGFVAESVYVECFAVTVVTEVTSE